MNKETVRLLSVEYKTVYPKPSTAYQEYGVDLSVKEACELIRDTRKLAQVKPWLRWEHNYLTLYFELTDDDLTEYKDRRYTYINLSLRVLDSSQESKASISKALEYAATFGK